MTLFVGRNTVRQNIVALLRKREWHAAVLTLFANDRSVILNCRLENLSGNVRAIHPKKKPVFVGNILDNVEINVTRIPKLDLVEFTPKGESED